MKLPAFAAASGLALAACASPPPPDVTKPTVDLYLLDPAPIMIGSTDPTADLRLGCPGGVDVGAAEAFLQSAYGETQWDEGAAWSTYYYDGVTPPFRFIVRVSDPSGVKRARAAFKDETIDAATPNGSIVIADISDGAAVLKETQAAGRGGVSKYRVVEMKADGEDAPAIAEARFTASTLGSAPYVSVSGVDGAGNDEAYFVWLLPKSVCR
ncbi:MAG: hypothetical protein AAFX03_06610 [Pseudomonadota bacterium]